MGAVTSSESQHTFTQSESSGSRHTLKQSSERAPARHVSAQTRIGWLTRANLRTATSGPDRRGVQFKAAFDGQRRWLKPCHWQDLSRSTLPLPWARPWHGNRGRLANMEWPSAQPPDLRVSSLITVAPVDFRAIEAIESAFGRAGSRRALS